MVSLAQSQAGIPITPDELDADDWLLNCANGVRDIHSGRLRPHQRDDLLTKQLSVAYNPLAKCPEFQAFLHKIFDGSVYSIHDVVRRDRGRDAGQRGVYHGPGRPRVPEAQGRQRRALSAGISAGIGAVAPCHEPHRFLWCRLLALLYRRMKRHCGHTPTLKT